MKGKLGFLLAALWLASAALSGYLRAEHAKLEPVKPVIRIQDVLLDLLGEGRTMLGRLLWFKMDMMHEQQDDLNVETFRQKEVVPLLRMINYLDPYLTDAYDTLAYDLYRGYGQLDKAIELIDEGLLYSPDSFELNFRRAFLAERQGDWVEALERSKKAFYADQDSFHQLAALRCMYRCALNRGDAKLGLYVIDTMNQIGGVKYYPEQYAKWQKELGQR